MAEADTNLEVVRAACPHDCPDTCAMLVTVKREGGKRVAIKVAGDPTHPTTAGTSVYQGQPLPGTHLSPGSGAASAEARWPQG